MASNALAAEDRAAPPGASAAAAAQSALDVSFGDQASTTDALDSTGVVPSGAPVVGTPSQVLSVTIPVAGSAADVSEADRAAVAAAIAAAAGLDVSEVQVSVIEAADGSVELVLFIAVGDDAAALADVESALDASFGDAAAGVTATTYDLMRAETTHDAVVDGDDDSGEHTPGHHAAERAAALEDTAAMLREAAAGVRAARPLVVAWFAFCAEDARAARRGALYGLLDGLVDLAL